MLTLIFEPHGTTFDKMKSPKTPTQKERIIGIDLDDVLLNFNDGLYEYRNSIHGSSYTRKDATSFALEDVWGCTRDEAVKTVLDYYLTEKHINSLPIAGAPEAVKELAKNNSLVLITAKPEHLREITTRWLDKHYQG